MKVKKFTGKSMPEAMKQVRAELGEDAVILNSKHVNSGGFLGLFAKKRIEVIAAVDQSSIEEHTKRSKPKKLPSTTRPNTNVDRRQRHDTSKLEKEVKELKKLVTSVSVQQQGQADYPSALAVSHQHLMEQEVNDRLRNQLMKQLLSYWYRSSEHVQPTESEVYQRLKTEIDDLLQDVPFGIPSPTKKIWNVVGPTGVGKTTTVAKIAAKFQLNEHKKVGLITTDTYRIAAVEQLKTYAQILQVPIEVAYTLEDFKKAKERFKDMDLILVDSAGRNYRNQLYVEELKKLIDFDEEVYTFLVLSLTSKYRDMQAIYEKFQFIDIDRLIFTKKDETSYLGPMINMVTDYDKGIAYITTGQNVPDDILEPTRKEVAEFIMGEMKDE